MTLPGARPKTGVEGCRYRQGLGHKVFHAMRCNYTVKFQRLEYSSPTGMVGYRKDFSNCSKLACFAYSLSVRCTCMVRELATGCEQAGLLFHLVLVFS